MGWCIILEQAIEEVIEKYSSFKEIVSAIHEFILENDEKKENKKEGKLELKVDSLKAIFEKEFKEKITKKKKVEKKPKKKKKSNLEEETKKKKEIKEHRTVTYSSEHERFLAENFYKSNLDYDNLFSYTFSGVKTNNFTDFYEEEKLAHNVTYKDMDTEEAKETLVSIQYATVLGSMTELSLEKRRQFANWVMFNKDLMKLFETTYGVTRDIDYAKTF